jgi:D-alanyl-D-alanine carboxypeptidase
MKRVFQLILVITFTFGFYQGVIDIHQKYTRDYFVYVGEILSIGKEVVAEQSSPYIKIAGNKINSGVNSAKGKMASISEAFEREDEVITIERKDLSKKGVYMNHSGEIKLSSDSYIVADLVSGKTIIEKDSDVVYPIASLTKLMTAIVSLDKLEQDIITKVSPDAVGAYGYAGNLEIDEEIKVSDLLFPLLLESSNDAAEVISEVYGKTFFMRQMNDKARELGLEDTFFDDPSGLSENNISTTKDIFNIAKYVHNNKGYIFDITMIPYKDLGDHTWYNNSSFIDDDRYIGSKNGYTDEADSRHAELIVRDQRCRRHGNSSSG